MTEATEAPPIDDSAVVEHILRHRDFFERHPALLAELDLRHASAGTVSLVERQVGVLRQRNAELREQLADLMANASANDGIFARTRNLTLGLMDAASAEALNDALAKHLVAGFQADHAVCFVRGWRPDAAFAHLRGMTVDGDPPLPRLFEQQNPSCSACREEEYQRLFPDSQLSGPGSVAMIPMRGRGQPDANLVIGATDARRFAADMGTVFLFYIGDVLSRTLARLRIGWPPG